MSTRGDLFGKTFHKLRIHGRMHFFKHVPECFKSGFDTAKLYAKPDYRTQANAASPANKYAFTKRAWYVGDKTRNSVPTPYTVFRPDLHISAQTNINTADTI